MDHPSQPLPLFTNSFPSANDDDYRSRTTLGAGVTQAVEPPRTVVIHKDAGSAPDDEAAAVELPPPYSSIALA
ncbi:hypothetical protein OG21DRAFT_1514989 [Imleria badia]|nr:hypothetical protein OG21DRAFT_1514989 [Imleria badia]